MKTWIASLFLFLILPFSAQAEPPSSASIEKLLAITHAEELVNGMSQQADQMMRTSVAEALRGKAMTPKMQAAMERFVEKTGQRLREDLSWDVIKEMMVNIYLDIYDQAEVDAMIAFYETPAGQSIIKKMPLTSQRSMEAVNQRMMVTLEKMGTDLEESLHEAVE